MKGENGRRESKEKQNTGNVSTPKATHFPCLFFIFSKFQSESEIIFEASTQCEQSFNLVRPQIRNPGVLIVELFEAWSQ